VDKSILGFGGGVMGGMFHGGAPGLKPGDIITPQSGTAHLVDGCPTCEARRVGAPLPEDNLDPTAVYVTTVRDYAKVYAAGYPLGAVYRVEPLGELTPSPDPVESYGVAAARVVSVLDPLVRLSGHEQRRLIRKFMGSVSS